MSNMQKIAQNVRDEAILLGSLPGWLDMKQITQHRIGDYTITLESGDPKSLFDLFSPHYLVTDSYSRIVSIQPAHEKTKGTVKDIARLWVDVPDKVLVPTLRWYSGYAAYDIEVKLVIGNRKNWRLIDGQTEIDFGYHKSIVFPPNTDIFDIFERCINQ